MTATLIEPVAQTVLFEESRDLAPEYSEILEEDEDLETALKQGVHVVALLLSKASSEPEERKMLARLLPEKYDDQYDGALLQRLGKRARRLSTQLLSGNLMEPICTADYVIIHAMLLFALSGAISLAGVDEDEASLLWNVYDEMFPNGIDPLKPLWKAGSRKRNREAVSRLPERLQIEHWFDSWPQLAGSATTS